MVTLGYRIHLCVPSHGQSTWPRLRAQQIFVEPTELPRGQLWQETEGKTQLAGLDPSPCLPLGLAVSPQNQWGAARLVPWQGVYGNRVGRGGLVPEPGSHSLKKVPVWLSE